MTSAQQNKPLKFGLESVLENMVEANSSEEYGSSDEEKKKKKVVVIEEPNKDLLSQDSSSSYKDSDHSKNGSVAKLSSLNRR